MKYTAKRLLFSLFLLPLSLLAQDNWVSYSTNIDIQKYEGKKFRLQAFIKTEGEDDGSAAMLWARIDKPEGRSFMDNMRDRPVLVNEWKKYTIEGKIDPKCSKMLFGMIDVYNGSFYYDDIKLEIETSKNKWSTIYNEDFENGPSKLTQGIEGKPGSGYNLLYTDEIIQDKSAPSGKAYLKITGKNVPNYGLNKKIGKYADVNGIKLYYEIYGTGQPLLVLHGNGGSISNASPHYPELIKKYQVIAIDSRGQGKSTDTDKPLTYDQMASDINELLNQIKIDSANVWGQSDGAILGLLLAKDYPKKVKKVLAFGANIQPDSLAIFSWSINHEAKIIKETKDLKEKKLLELMRDYPNVAYADLDKIKAPVLLMAGDRDFITPEHTVKMFQNIPNSQLCILPGSTHGASWERKELFLQFLFDFFDKPFQMPDTKDWYKED